MIAVLLIAPSLLILLGLYGMNSVPSTFVMFYGWLALVPFLDAFLIRRGSILKPLAAMNINFRAKSVWFGLASGNLFMVIIFYGLSWLQRSVFDAASLKILLGDWGFSGQRVLGLALVLTVLNPVLEEVYWRGFIFAKLRRNCGFMTTNLVTAFFYSLYHVLSIASIFKFPFNLVGVLPVFFAGITWGFLLQRYQSLSGPFLSHLMADIGIILIYFRFLN